MNVKELAEISLELARCERQLSELRDRKVKLETSDKPRAGYCEIIKLSSFHTCNCQTRS